MEVNYPVLKKLLACQSHARTSVGCTHGASNALGSKGTEYTTCKNYIQRQLTQKAFCSLL